MLRFKVRGGDVSILAMERGGEVDICKDNLVLLKKLLRNNSKLELEKSVIIFLTKTYT